MPVGSRRGRGDSHDDHEHRQQAVDPAAQRLERVIAAVDRPASITVLIGESGSGRTRLAVRAAEAVRERLGDADVIVVGAAAHASGDSVSASTGDPGGLEEHRDPPEGAPRVLEQLERRAEGRELILVVPHIDGYAPGDTRSLAALADARRARIVATAKHLTSEVERLCNGPNGHLVSIGPLDRAESEAYLVSLLGVERIEAETLHRWHQASGGNLHALSVLALASDRMGALHRSRGAAWVSSDEDVVPGDFADLLTESCSRGELDVLETIAVAEPVVETSLLRALDAACLSSLFERGLVASQTHEGALSLVLGPPLLAASLRTRMSPVRRIQLNDRIFRALDEDRGGADPTHLPDRLMRLVAFGLEGGRSIPLSWLWTAFELTARNGGPRVILRLAMATAVHPDADATQAGAAALRAFRIASLLGDDVALRSTMRVIDGLLDAADRAGALGTRLGISLRTALLRQLVWDGEELGPALRALDRLDREADLAEDPVAAEMVRSTRVLLLACSGRIRDAAETAPDPELSADLGVEWVRSPARAVQALILEQQGALHSAVQCAESARRLSRLGARFRTDHIDLQGFCWLLGYWGSGSSETARQVLDELVAEAYADTHAEARYSGLVEVGAVLLGVQEGRWSEVVESGERLVERFARRDRYGLEPLAQAALALALAVLGEREAALRAIRAADAPRPGMARALGGHGAVLALRARQWLRCADALAEAERIAAWAREEGLALIELQALHTIAFETRSPSDELRARARSIAARIDPTVGGAFAAHIERIAAPPGVTAADSDEPEVRLLADLGVWLPLPPAPGLTAREREVALLAALGHSSRFIAERLYISVRTVETHLSNVFAKLDVENRDELGRWVTRHRTSLTSV
ncbi:helix-turn-helix transcriptional regulator [Leucobacter triazinivorans]|uniref:LuxR family transcriptional regulator n=1 Tax=Leucobacter triazinivorans TaxID=1784719 RepID=A0A4P6KFJ7_9MICO|nr:helix-turn-helix transcriptional regulator [Leucobacter triazinivorans]QBE48718.1 LuxR family transcriptional regulator [Leucobacter triazinivorans]